MRRTAGLAFLIALLVLPSSLPAQEGRLKKFEKGVEKKDKPKESPPPRQEGDEEDSREKRSADRSSGSDEDGFFNDLFVEIFLYPFAAAFRAAFQWVTDVRPIRYASPYQNEAHPYAWHDEEGGGTLTFIARADYERADADLWAYHGGVEIRSPYGYALEGNFTRYVEDVPNQGQRDRLDWQTYILSKDLVAEGRFYASAGLGMAALSGDTNHGGLALQARVDVFPVEPIGLHAKFLAAPIEEATLGEVEAGVGVFVSRVEAFAGWRSFMNSRSGNITGPVFGIAFWY